MGSESESSSDSATDSESDSASDVESHSVSDSETDSELDTQCAIRVQYFEIIALSRGIIMMNMVAIAHQMISSEWN